MGGFEDRFSKKSLEADFVNPIKRVPIKKFKNLARKADFKSEGKAIKLIF